LRAQESGFFPLRQAENAEPKLPEGPIRFRARRHLHTVSSSRCTLLAGNPRGCRRLADSSGETHNDAANSDWRKIIMWTQMRTLALASCLVIGTGSAAFAQAAGAGAASAAGGSTGGMSSSTGAGSSGTGSSNPGSTGAAGTNGANTGTGLSGSGMSNPTAPGTPPAGTPGASPAPAPAGTGQNNGGGNSMGNTGSGLAPAGH
jgi:hypothetical protein